MKYRSTILFILCFYKSFGQLSHTHTQAESGTKLKGALTLSSSYNTGIQQYTNPFYYFLSGNLNLKINQLNIPVSGNYSNRTFQYTLPYDYNYVSLSPNYKWVRANFGTNFMQFSPYSLNGHQYKGVGLQLTPGKWQIKTMYGQLFKANEAQDSLRIQANYKRIAMGGKVKYNGNLFNLAVSVFKAKDILNSLELNPIMPLGKENLILTNEFGINFSKRLVFNLEYSNSAIIQNSAEKEASTEVTKHFLGKYIAKKPSLRVGNALKTALNYNIVETGSLIGLQYERIDPAYESLGGYYFINDFENVTFQLSQPFLERRLFFNGVIGTQRDNLKFQKSTQQRRWVGSANLNIVPSPKFSAGISYSNFSAYTNIRSAFDEIRKLNTFEQLDTLNYQQITQNISTNMEIELGQNDKESHHLNTMVSWLQSANKQGEIVRIGQLSTFTNGNISYNFQQKPTHFGIGIGANLTQNTIGTENGRSVGPTLHIKKGFFKNKFQTNIYASQIYSEDKLLNKIARFSNLRFYMLLKINKNNQFNFNSGYTLGQSDTKREYFSSMLGYSIRF